MEQTDRIHAFADRAAALIPESPADGDATSYLAWCELVWSTASSLGCMLGRAPDGTRAALLLDESADVADGTRITGDQLLCRAFESLEIASITLEEDRWAPLIQPRQV